MLMVNQDYATPDQVLADGDEVVFVPPVSGGRPGKDGANTGPTRFHVGPDALDARSVEAMVASPAAGAVITFTGTVRDNARGEEVSVLVYEAYEPAAERQLAVIAGEIASMWPIAVEQVAIHHRIGPAGARGGVGGDRGRRLASRRSVRGVTPRHRADQADCSDLEGRALRGWGRLGR